MPLVAELTDAHGLPLGRVVGFLLRCPSRRMSPPLARPRRLVADGLSTSLDAPSSFDGSIGQQATGALRSATLRTHSNSAKLLRLQGTSRQPAGSLSRG